MKVQVHDDQCIGCALCTSICEGVFRMNDDFKSELIEGSATEENKECIENAAENCPVNAIEIEK